MVTCALKLLLNGSRVLLQLGSLLMFTVRVNRGHHVNHGLNHVLYHKGLAELTSPLPGPVITILMTLAQEGWLHP